MTKTMVFGMSYTANTICRVLLCHQRKKPIGIWGQRYKRYLKEYRKATYTTLLTGGREKSLPLFFWEVLLTIRFLILFV